MEVGGGGGIWRLWRMCGRELFGDFRRRYVPQADDWSASGVDVGASGIKQHAWLFLPRPLAFFSIDDMSRKRGKKKDIAITPESTSITTEKHGTTPELHSKDSSLTIDAHHQHPPPSRMGKTKRDTVTAAHDAFHRHYAQIWGHDRWHSSLYPALLRPSRQVALLNPAVPLSRVWEALGGEGLRRPVDDGDDNDDDDDNGLHEVAFPVFSTDASPPPRCLTRPLRPTAANPHADPPPLPAPQLCNTPHGPLHTHWNLDAASVLITRVLAPRAADRILDLCAAPGGKAIALAHALVLAATADPTIPITTTPPFLLHANDADPTRAHRLAANLRAYVPACWAAPTATAPRGLRTSNVDATRRDAHRELASGGDGAPGYDKVLVDAPCSTERHVVQAHARAASATTGLARWRAGTARRLQEEQTRLLVTGLRCARVGGRVVYATCSVESGENDGVVERVERQCEREGRGWAVEVGGCEGEEERVLREWAQRTPTGWIVLPDHSAGGRWGPLFFAVLTKVARPTG